MSRRTADSARGTSKIPYGRNMYPSRGKRPSRDIIAESMVAPLCVVCGTGLVRKTGKSGRTEAYNVWLNRKTCGMNIDKNGKFVKTDCLKKYITGKGNPNFKNLQRFCLGCGDKLVGYVTKEAREKGEKDPVRCRDCWMQWAGKHEIYIKSNRKNALKRRGIYPEHLRPYALKKGHNPWNKKYDTCQVPGCNKKHLAKGMCGMHYQRVGSSLPTHPVEVNL
jgi:hypothetical protein